MSLDLKELSKNQLIDKQYDFKKSNLPDDHKNLITAHLDFLIRNHEIKKPVDLKAKVEDYLALKSEKRKHK